MGILFTGVSSVFEGSDDEDDSYTRAVFLFFYFEFE